MLKNFKYDYFGFQTIIHADEIVTGKKFIEKLVECEKQILKVPGLQGEYRLLSNNILQIVV